MDLVDEISKKREFSCLPKSVIERVLSLVDVSLCEKDKIREARIILRKYFGVFLTNKVVKPKDVFNYNSVLLSHKSSQKRDYNIFYDMVRSNFGFDDNFKLNFIDLGSGVNGFSYPYLKNIFGNVFYRGVEASKFVVDNTNLFFKRSGYSENCACVWGDLFDENLVFGILRGVEKNRVVFLFQVIDALENLERDFSKDFFLRLKNDCELILVSLPLLSLCGKKRFEVRRKWILDFFRDNFVVLNSCEMFGELFIFLKCT
jgi:hypothetical protein